MKKKRRGKKEQEEREQTKLRRAYYVELWDQERKQPIESRCSRFYVRSTTNNNEGPAGVVRFTSMLVKYHVVDRGCDRRARF